MSGLRGFGGGLSKISTCLPIVLLSLLPILLAACQGEVSATLRASPTVTPQLPTRTVEPLPSPSVTLTTIPIPTLEPTSTPVPASATPTPTPTPEVVRFAVIGDYGMAGPDAAAVAERVLSWEPAFIITTGDNNYPNGAPETIDQNIGQYYHAYVHPYQGAYGDGAEINRFFPSLGNHDLNTARGQAYFDYFTLPGNERYYDFVWGPVHFFALNSDSREPDGVSSKSTQAVWLQEQLRLAPEPWKVVYMHHPPYSSGLHGSIAWMQWPFQEWGASVVISGHDHLYERLSVNGMPFLINGLGGYLRYYFLAPNPASQVRFNDDYGAILVEASAVEMNFQFITQAGVVVDHFFLTAPQQ